MSKCMNCGGFVTDTYARVFGDNDDNVFDCRNCRTDRRLSESDDGEEGDDEKVLLSSVRGDDAGGSGNATTAADDGAVTHETFPVTDGGVAAVATGDERDGREPKAADGGGDQRADDADPEGRGVDDDGRFGIGRLLSALRP